MFRAHRLAAVDAGWLEELSSFLRIPSVSADPAHAADVARAGEWVCDFVRRAGGGAELVPTGGHNRGGTPGSPTGPLLPRACVMPSFAEPAEVRCVRMLPLRS